MSNLIKMYLSTILLFSASAYAQIYKCEVNG